MKHHFSKLVEQMTKRRENGYEPQQPSAAMVSAADVIDKLTKAESSAAIRYHYYDKSRITEATFKVGDYVVYGSAHGKIKRLTSDAAVVEFYAPEDVKRYGEVRVIPFFELRLRRADEASEIIRRIAEDFYAMPLEASLGDILDKVKNGDKPSLTWDAMLSPEELWPYREFTRTKENNRHSPEEWEDMKTSMSEKGWDTRNPLALMVGEDGTATVVDGNHRLALAKECGLESIPVKLTFVKDLKKASRA